MLARLKDQPAPLAPSNSRLCSCRQFAPSPVGQGRCAPLRKPLDIMRQGRWARPNMSLWASDRRSGTQSADHESPCDVLGHAAIAEIVLVKIVGREKLALLGGRDEPHRLEAPHEQHA